MSQKQVVIYIKGNNFEEGLDFNALSCLFDGAVIHEVDSIEAAAAVELQGESCVAAVVSDIICTQSLLHNNVLSYISLRKRLFVPIFLKH